MKNRDPKSQVIHYVLFALYNCSVALGNTYLLIARFLSEEDSYPPVRISRAEIRRIQKLLHETERDVAAVKEFFAAFTEELHLLVATDNGGGYVSLSESGLDLIPPCLREQPGYTMFMKALNRRELPQWRQAKYDQCARLEQKLLGLKQEIKQLESKKPQERGLLLTGERTQRFSMRLLPLATDLRQLTHELHLAASIFERWPLVRQ